MQKSDSNQKALATHRKVQSSTTLNRKYVRRPTRSDDTTVSIKRSPKIKRFDEGGVMARDERTTSSAQQVEQPMSVEKHPIQITVNSQMRSRTNESEQAQAPKLTAKEIKDQAIQKALAVASTTNTASVQKSTKSTKSRKARMKNSSQVHFGFGRVMLALSCAAVAVFAIVYFVNSNMPDISLRVAAMQTGIEASYPGYVPRDYSLTDITSEDGKITLNFRNSTTGESFMLIEERSSWDSNALMTNYVQEAYGENYTVIREQGLTIYNSNSDAAWVNGGIVYKLKMNSGSLTKKQLKTIATSL